MRKFSRFIAVFLSVCLAAGLCSFGAAAGEVISIGNAADLAKIGTNGYPMDGSYKLTADIALSGSWTPIGKGYFHAGTQTPVAFTGTFDGNGKTISGLRIVPSTEDDAAGNAATTANKKNDGTNEYSHNADTTVLAQGMFSYVSGATIKNLKIASPDVTGWNYAGALAGIAENSTITGITVTNPTIFCHWENAGGILGTVRDTAVGTSTVSGCAVSGGSVSTPQQEENQNGAGGLIGRIQNGTNTISDNTVTGTSVTAYRKAAGLVGYVLQPTRLTMSGNVVSNVVLSIDSAAKNKLNTPTPYYGILFGEVQGSPNTNRAYETYTDNNYATGWSGTSQDSKIAITGGKTTLANNTASGATVSMAQGVSEYVASVVGGSSYGYINSAIQAADSGDTVKVLKDFTTAKAIYVSKPLTLDLNGKTITSSASQVIRADAALTINATNGGTVNATASSNPFILVETAGITINGGTFTAANSAYSLFIGNGTTATVNDGTFNGWIYSNGSYTGVHVTFNGGTFNKMVYLAAKDISVTYNGGTFNAGTEFKGSTVTVNDGTFKGNGNTPTHNASGNGSSTNGAWALAVVDNKGYGAAKVTINGGKFTGMVEKLDDDSDTSNNDDTLTISGGYFTSDPTAYVADGKAAKTTTEPGYSFTVGDAVKEAATPAVAAPEVSAPQSVTSEVKDAVSNTEITGTTLSDAANTKAKENTVSTDVGAADLNKALNSSNATSENTKIVVQTYLDLNIISADTTGATKTIIIDITPMYRTVATSTDTDNSNIKTSGDGQNAVVVGQAKELSITKSTTITIEVPSSFAGATVYIQHKGHEYKGAVTTKDSKYYLTFTNPDGFSEFTLSTESQEVAKIGDNSYTTLQAAIDAAPSGSTIELTADIPGAETATVSGKSLTIKCNGKTLDYTHITTGEYVTKAVSTGDNKVIKFTYTAPAAEAAYTVTVSAAENGAVTSSAASSEAGRTVTLTVAPAAGYALDTLTVKDASGAAVTTAKASDTSYTFTMPASNVTVTPSFKKASRPSGRFTDVDPKGWYIDAIDYVVSKGLFNGITDTTFEPNSPMDRAMLVTVMYRLAGSPAVTGTHSFTDVPAGAYYEKALLWSVQNKVINGITDTVFGPTLPATREQVAAVLYRFAKANGTDVSVGEDTNILSYDDANEISEYAIPAFQWACGAGILEGDNNKLMPKNNATRAQVAVILMRFCGKTAK